MIVNSEVPSEHAHLRRLVRAIANRLCDKNQISHVLAQFVFGLAAGFSIVLTVGNEVCCHSCGQ